LVVVTLVCVAATSCHQKPDTEELKKEGQTTIDALERFRNAHARYPESLTEAGIRLPEGKYGEWGYRRFQDGNCQIYVGDYRKHGFRLSWTNNAWWYHDG